jgi:hypothetical protein
MTEGTSSPLRDGAPSGSPGSYASKEEITSLLRGTAPASVTASGQGYVDLANTYDQAMTDLRRFAHDLADAWKGPASIAAQHQLRELFAAAFEISARSSEVGNAVKTHGTSYLAWYQQSMPTPKTVEEARQWMQGANARAAQTWTAIPADISTGLPSISTDRRSEYGPPTTGSGTDGAASPDGSVSVSGSGTAGGCGSKGSGSAIGAGGRHVLGHAGSGGTGEIGTPGHSAGPGTIPGTSGAGGIAGANSVAGTVLSGLDPKISGGGAPGAGSGGGLGAGGSAGGDLPGGRVGGASGGAIGVDPGAAPRPGSIGGALGRNQPRPSGAAPAGRPGMPGLGSPGVPASGGQSEKERSRSAWIGDDEIWGDDMEAVPAVIGDAPPKPAAPQNTQDQDAPDEAELLHRVLARLEALEGRDNSDPPGSREPRIEWTD